MSLSEYRKIISRLHVIIRVVTLTAQLSCRYQSIVTLSTVSISLSSIVKVSEVFMPLSEYRHIISNLHSIIRLSSHYQLTHTIIRVSQCYRKSTCHYQIIVTSSEFSIPLSENRHIISRLYGIFRISSHYQQVFMMLSEYRHIISRFPWCYQSIVTYQISLHVIIRVLSHYQQTLPHYQNIETLSADSTSLSEYRHIISIISIFIIITVQWYFCIYTIIFLLFLTIYFVSFIFSSDMYIIFTSSSCMSLFSVYCY